MSVDSPTPRANSSVSSKIGVSIRRVAGALEQLPRGSIDSLASDGVGREDVEGALRGLEAIRHLGASLDRWASGYRASSARNGLVAFSAPSVVIPMCPG